MKRNYPVKFFFYWPGQKPFCPFFGVPDIKLKKLIVSIFENWYKKIKVTPPYAVQAIAAVKQWAVFHNPINAMSVESALKQFYNPRALCSSWFVSGLPFSMINSKPIKTLPFKLGPDMAKISE